jgi:predicted enzyme related to lactoylglutathione lyase
MAMLRTYPPGVPCWIDTEQPDPPRARNFYRTILDWDFEDVGDYHVGLLGGRPVAAIAAASANPGPVSWNTYISVADADASAEAVTDAGGTVEREPADVGAAGRVALCADPAGARFRLWQPGARAGAQAVNVPGTWNFSDLHTPDAETALRFYREVFGWEAKAIDAGAAEWATLLQVKGYGKHLRETVDSDIDERQAGAPEGFADGIAWMASLAPDGDLPHWHVTISVVDRAETVKTAQRLGAEIVSELDTRWNRSAVIVDPQGAALTVSQFLGG